MWQCRDCLYGSKHCIEGAIFWPVSIPERSARLPLKCEFVRDVVIVFVHRFVVRVCEECGKLGVPDKGADNPASKGAYEVCVRWLDGREAQPYSAMVYSLGRRGPRVTKKSAGSCTSSG